MAAFSTIAAIAGTAISAGTALNSASQANKANKRAIEANNIATDKQLAAQDKALNTNVALNQPFITGGQGAYDALLTRYGLGSSAAKPGGGNAGTSPLASGQPTMSFDARAPGLNVPRSEQDAVYAANNPTGDRKQGGAAPGGTAVPQTPAGPDFNAYDAANPDLAANNWYGEHPPESVGDLNGDGQVNRADSAALHYQLHGQGEGRALPTTQAQPQQQQGPAPTPTGPQTPTDMMTAQRPSAAPAPTFGSAPAQSFEMGDFFASPDYKFRYDEAMRGANASYAGRGLLKSDAAVKGVMDRGSNLASAEYSNWFNRKMQQQQADRGQFNADRATGLTQYNNDTARNDNIFNTDRNYQTTRYDTDTGNLFDLTNIGLRAAGNVSGAQDNYAANTGNIFGAQANAASNAAANRAQTNSQLGGALGGAATSALNYFGSGNPQPFSAQTVNANPYTAMPNFDTTGFRPSSMPSYSF